MPTTIAALRTRVATILADASNQIWSTTDLDEAIRRALHNYSNANPRKRITTITLSTATREISTASITDIIAIEEIWLPYDATNPNAPINRRAFRFWKDAATIYILSQYMPQPGDIARIFYAALHTINGLDSASSTTLPDEHTSTIAFGAAGYAAASRAIDLAEQVSIDRNVTDRLTTWAQQTLQRFYAELQTITIIAQGPGHVPLPALDRFDNPWS
jgi:hypothetical protein